MNTNLKNQKVKNTESKLPANLQAVKQKPISGNVFFVYK